MAFLQLAMYVDMYKLGLWRGLCFHTNGLQIHGQSITADAVGNLMPVSDLEATPATRLFELWIQQHFFDDQLAIKLGQRRGANHDKILTSPRTEKTGVHFANSIAVSTNLRDWTSPFYGPAA